MPSSDFSALARYTDDAVARLDAVGRVVFQNAAAERLTALPAAVARLRPELRSTFATGMPHALDVEIAGPDGPRRLAVRLLPEWEGGAAIGGATVLLVARDVTAQHRAESALRDTESLFRQMADSIREVFWLTDATTRRVMYVSPAFDALWGIPRETLYADPEGTGALIHPEDREATHAAFAAMWRGELDEHEYRIVRPDGAVRWLASRTYPVRDAEGRVYRIAGVASDVTSRKRVEVALEERTRAAERARRQTDAVLASISDAFFALDREWRLTYVNDRARQILGRSNREVIGRVFWELFPAALGTPFEAAYREVMATGASTTVEAQVPGFDGWFAARVYPGPDGIGVYFQDVTAAHRAADAMRELEEQLRQAQKMEAVGRLAGGVAHDFNNLLQVILTQARFALDALPEGSEVRRDVEAVHAAGSRASDLTRQLLAFSRKQVLQPRALDLNAVVCSVEPMLRRLIGEDIAVEARLAPSSGSVFADPAQVEQVLVNLAVNARDAMPDGGRLVIETSRLAARDFVRLTVRDTGVGMDEATLARAFEPFFTTKPLGAGTGLGLATVYGIVTQSGGRVALESALGAGTAVHVDLPRAHACAEVAPAPQATPAAGTGTVLLVEDDDAVRAAVRRALARHGYTVLEAADGHEALALVAGGASIDLALCDVVMPGMNGRAVAERLSAERPGLRVLFMSGYNDDEILRRGLATPSASFLEKPFTVSALLEAVRRAVTRDG